MDVNSQKSLRIPYRDQKYYGYFDWGTPLDPLNFEELSWENIIYEDKNAHRMSWTLPCLNAIETYRKPELNGCRLCGTPLQLSRGYSNVYIACLNTKYHNHQLTKDILKLWHSWIQNQLCFITLHPSRYCKQWIKLHHKSCQPRKTNYRKPQYPPPVNPQMFNMSMVVSGSRKRW